MSRKTYGFPWMILRERIHSVIYCMAPLSIMTFTIMNKGITMFGTELPHAVLKTVFTSIICRMTSASKTKRLVHPVPMPIQRTIVTTNTERSFTPAAVRPPSGGRNQMIAPMRIARHSTNVFLFFPISITLRSFPIRIQELE